MPLLAGPITIFSSSDPHSCAYFHIITHMQNFRLIGASDEHPPSSLPSQTQLIHQSLLQIQEAPLIASPIIIFSSSDPHSCAYSPITIHMQNFRLIGASDKYPPYSPPLELQLIHQCSLQIQGAPLLAGPITIFSLPDPHSCAYCHIITCLHNFRLIGASDASPPPPLGPLANPHLFSKAYCKSRGLLC